MLILLLHLAIGNIFLFSYDVIKNGGYIPSMFAFAFFETLGMTVIISSIAYLVNVYTNISRKDLLLRRPLQNVEMWMFISPPFIIICSILAGLSSKYHYGILYRIMLAIHGLYMISFSYPAIMFYIKRQEITTFIVILILFTTSIGAMFHTIFLEKIDRSVFAYIVWTIYRGSACVYCCMWCVRSLLMREKKRSSSSGSGPGTGMKKLGSTHAINGKL